MDRPKSAYRIAQDQKWERSVRKWVYGEEVEGEIFTKQEYKNKIRVRLRDLMTPPPKKTPAQIKRKNELRRLKRQIQLQNGG